MDVATLRMFTEVAHRGSFAAVARDRLLDPSSVSRTIAQLEQELGVRLFQRSTRRLTLTEGGARYLERISPLLDGLAEAEDEARAGVDAPAGSLRISTSVAFGQAWLMPRLVAFRATYPQLGLELLLSDARVDLIAERIDLAIRLGPDAQGDLIGAKLIDTRYRVCASPAYLAKARRLSVPEDLAAHRCLRFSLPEFRTRWRFRDAAGRVTEIPVDGDVIVSNALVLRDCARAGMGPALLPDWLVEPDLAAGALRDCLPGHDAAATSFETAAWLLYPSRTQLPRKVRVAIDFLRSRPPAGAIARAQGQAAG